MVKLIKIMNTYTKIALGFYSFCVLLRTAMYLKVLVLIAPLELNKPQDFGGFLAVYAENDTLATIITIILMLIYASCFLSTIFLIFVTRDLAVYTEEREQEAQMREEEQQREKEAMLLQQNAGRPRGSSLWPNPDKESENGQSAVNGPTSYREIEEETPQIS